ncbi:hypothetical protein [Bradyrhizobium sp. AZCC 2289]|uniref:hypothetical protein n=1 Tax=Bradyrhizobium sp. AZCC 2289 TaxID=3117026 RepID=UPI002FF024AF
MAPGEVVSLVAFGKYARGVGLCGVEQPIICRFANGYRRYQRLRNQARHRIDDLRVVCLRAGDRQNGLEREDPDEDRQPAQDQLVALLQQVIAPGEHRVQCLVARQRSAPALPEQLETIIEQVCRSANPKGSDVTGRKFDGKRNSVEPAADPGDDRRIGIAQP